MEKKTDVVAAENPECADVPCATDCNTDWQTCREENPDKKGVCDTKLAKCVKDCDTQKK